jgi:hypothetical protein
VSDPIAIRAKVLGDAQLSKVFLQAGSELRARLVDELEAIGKEVVSLARAAVPKGTKPLGKRKSRTVQRIVYRMGIQDKGKFQKTESGPLMLTVFPGEPLGHLIERGVDAVISTRRRKQGDVRAGRDWTTRRQSRKLLAMGISFVKPYRLHQIARPYFTPATQRVNAGDRLQAVVSRSAAEAVDKFWNA